MPSGGLAFFYACDNLMVTRDVAQLVLFLGSDESKHISGAEMVIDNGDTVVQMSGPGGN